jgi:hypothetical protein
MKWLDGGRAKPDNLGEVSTALEAVTKDSVVTRRGLRKCVGCVGRGGEGGRESGVLRTGDGARCVFD